MSIKAGSLLHPNHEIITTHYKPPFILTQYTTLDPLTMSAVVVALQLEYIKKEVDANIIQQACLIALLNVEDPKKSNISIKALFKSIIKEQDEDKKKLATLQEQYTTRAIEVAKKESIEIKAQLKETEESLDAKQEAIEKENIARDIEDPFDDLSPEEQVTYLTIITESREIWIKEYAKLPQGNAIPQGFPEAIPPQTQYDMLLQNMAVAILANICCGNPERLKILENNNLLTQLCRDFNQSNESFTEKMTSRLSTLHDTLFTPTAHEADVQHPNVHPLRESLRADYQKLSALYLPKTNNEMLENPSATSASTLVFKPTTLKNLPDAQ